MRTYTDDDMVEALSTIVASAGLKKVAENAKVSIAFVSAVTTRRRAISPKLLDYLGFERIPAQPRYRRKSK